MDPSNYCTSLELADEAMRGSSSSYILEVILIKRIMPSYAPVSSKNKLSGATKPRD